MTFRITDLVLLTTAVAMFIAVFQVDLLLFRQLSCFLLIAAFSFVAAVSCQIFSPRSRVLGAFGGLAGGLIYATAAYSLASTIYPFVPIYIARQSLVKDVQYLEWFNELGFVLLLSPLLGSAIGPLMSLRIRIKNISTETKKRIWFSVAPLAAAFLLALFAMFDRLTMFGDSRDWSPLIIVLLIIFVIYTNSWLQNNWHKGKEQAVETDEISVV